MSVLTERDNSEQKDKELQIRREQELADIKALLYTKEGLRFFKRLIEEGHIFKTTFTGNSNSFFLEGQRNLVLKFLADIAKAAPEKITELIINKGD